MSLVKEYKRYTKQWPLIPMPRKKLGHAFWHETDTMEAYPTLSRLGRWYGQLPTSSIAVERLFAKMRAMEGPQDMAMKEDAFVALLKLRQCQWIIDSMLGDEFAKYGRLVCFDEEHP